MILVLFCVWEDAGVWARWDYPWDARGTWQTQCPVFPHPESPQGVLLGAGQLQWLGISGQTEFFVHWMAVTFSVCTNIQTCCNIWTSEKPKPDPQCRSSCRLTSPLTVIAVLLGKEVSVHRVQSSLSALETEWSEAPIPHQTIKSTPLQAHPDGWRPRQSLVLIFLAPQVFLLFSFLWGCFLHLAAVPQNLSNVEIEGCPKDSAFIFCCVSASL